MLDPNQHSDEELWRRLAQGDETAFTTLYRRRQPGVYRFALQMCGHPQMAEEVVQETFLALFRGSHRFDPEQGTLASYLYGVARNQMLRMLSRDKAYVGVTEDDEWEGVPSGGGDPLLELTRQESIDALRQAVLALPAMYREVVVLCDLHEMSYVDAAAVVRCPVGTVRSRLNRGRLLLAEKLCVMQQGKGAANGTVARCSA